MLKIIPSNNRHFTNFGWLKTYWLFSFANYFDPENIQHGALRVFNDDVVEPGTGFPTHPHNEMEIVTIVLDGEITHKDSMGNKTVIKAGDVQRMSAGTGLTHSEYNLSEKPVHFYQVWIYPDDRGLNPTYDQKSFPKSSWQNKLLPIASGQGLDDAVTFHTDATIYRCDLFSREKIDFNLKDSRRIFIYLTAGELDINGQIISSKDQARIENESKLIVKAKQKSSFILIDCPACGGNSESASRGWGYKKETLQGEKK